MIKKVIAIFFILSIFTQTYASLELPRKEVFKFLWDNIITNIPKSYKYIELNYKDLDKSSPNYDSLQKMVYYDLIENKSVNINLNNKISLFVFYSLLEKQTWYDFVTEDNKELLKKLYVTNEDITLVKNFLNKNKDIKSLNSLFLSNNNILIFNDVYNTLINDHYDSEKIDKQNLIYSTIEWLAKGSGDKYSVYFPPTDARDFEENLSWEFEWIWAYVDMEKPWELKIVSPIVWSPAEKYWLKWWDIITKIDWVEVTKSITLKEAVSKIKWKVWTIVKIEVLRNWEKIFFDIERAKIIINDVESKIINDKYFYIQMRIFWDKIFSQTTDAINDLNTKQNIKKVIIDLRNNPWWYLDQASSILSLFIDKWLPVAQVKYKNWVKSYDSVWYKKIDLSKYEVYILVNSWTASASEILVWTLKDYFPNIKIIWEKTYWKWSVQTIKDYSDGSSFKYTIAKWFTWKTSTWIDWVWIYPDIELKFDIEKFKTWIDNQLDYILNLK